MALEIRKLQRNDKEQWLGLWRGYQEFYNADLSSDEDALFERLLAPEADGPFGLVAIEDGAMLGITHYLFHKTSWGPEPRCYLNDLFTSATARGKGVATSLIEAVDSDARSHGCSQTWWLTQDFNKTARSLYDKLAQKTPFIKYVK